MNTKNHGKIVKIYVTDGKNERANEVFENVETAYVHNNNIHIYFMEDSNIGGIHFEKPYNFSRIEIINMNKKYYKTTSKRQDQISQAIFHSFIVKISMGTMLDQETGLCVFHYYDKDDNRILSIVVDRKGNIK